MVIQAVWRHLQCTKLESLEVGVFSVPVYGPLEPTRAFPEPEPISNVNISFCTPSQAQLNATLVISIGFGNGLPQAFPEPIENDALSAKSSANPVAIMRYYFNKIIVK
jgi:hypothetical protein